MTVMVWIPLCLEFQYISGFKIIYLLFYVIKKQANFFHWIGKIPTTQNVKFIFPGHVTQIQVVSSTYGRKILKVDFVRHQQKPK